MTLTILRTAFLACVRALLCLQALSLWFLALGVRTPGVMLLFGLLGLAGVTAAFLLRRGRRWAAVAAILMEALWAAAAAWFGYWDLTEGVTNWRLLGYLTLGGALFLAAAAGLLLRPVRDYTGLVRR